MPWLFSGSLKGGLWKISYSSLVGLERSFRLTIAILMKWYNVSSRVLVEDNGGDELLKIYCGSLSLALASVYPDHEWLGLPWKFEIVSHQSFGKAHNIKRHFFELARQVLGADKLSDWYKGVTF